MKTVFSSNSQVAHVWAQQTQSHGRCGNVFFEGNAAMIHTVKGKKVCLIRADAYSNSTGGHLRDIADAVKGLYPVFYVSERVDSLSHARKYLDGQAKIKAIEYSKKSKVVNDSQISISMANIVSEYAEADEFRKLLMLKPVKRDFDLLNKVKTHLEARLKRFNELNTPEQKAKNEVERLKRQAIKEVELHKKLAENIVKFRNGQQVWGLHKLPHELLRIQGDEVVTSRGARVPLEQAKNAYEALVRHGKVIGTMVGEFSINQIIPKDNDIVITIGCHRILLSEATAVLGTPVKNKLTLVKDVG